MGREVIENLIFARYRILISSVSCLYISISSYAPGWLMYERKSFDIEFQFGLQKWVVRDVDNPIIFSPRFLIYCLPIHILIAS